MKIFEFKIVDRKTESSFHRCVEAANIKEATEALKQKNIDFERNYYELNAIITEEQYERLVQKARWHQHYLQTLFDLAGSDVFDEMVELISQKYAVTLSGTEIEVYPTLDSTFRRGMKVES